MTNNYLLLGPDTLPRETAFHRAGHLLAEHLFSQHVFGRDAVPDFMRHARLRATQDGAVEAIAELVTVLSFSVDIAVANGFNELHDIFSEHVDHCVTRDTCPAPEHRAAAWHLLCDDTWIDDTALLILQHHWWAVSNLAERLAMGETPDPKTIAALLDDERCSPYAWERTTIEPDLILDWL